MCYECFSRFFWNWKSEYVTECIWCLVTRGCKAVFCVVWHVLIGTCYEVIRLQGALQNLRIHWVGKDLWDYLKCRKMWLLPLSIMVCYMYCITTVCVWYNQTGHSKPWPFCFSLRSWVWNKCRSRKTTWNGKEIIGCWTAGGCFVSLSCSYRCVSQGGDSCTEISLGEFFLLFASLNILLSCKLHSMTHRSWGIFIQQFGQKPTEMQ